METLRLFPPVPIIAPELNKNLKLTLSTGQYLPRLCDQLH